MPTFGGKWTEEKLDRVEKYLVAYRIALKRKGFNLIYIDAFCGDGSISRKYDDALLLEETAWFTVGSARRALSLTPPFHQYHFIDNKIANIKKIKEMVTTEFNHLVERCNFHSSDVNECIPSILNNLDTTKDRAVLFADPFGMQLDWSTVEKVAKCPIIDFWYLVPTGTINRLVTRDGEMPPEWAHRLDRLLTTVPWRDKWYQASTVEDLFECREENRKVASINEIESDFQNALTTIFPKVAERRLQLKHRGKVLFTLMFACANRSPAAHNLAVKIANDLLKE